MFSGANFLMVLIMSL